MIIRAFLRASRHRKILISVFVYALVGLIVCNVGVACLHPQVVYASVAGTIAGYILTLFASFNTAITNPEVVNAINNTFGQMSMIEADAALIDQGIASIAASTGFDMASIFATTAEEAAQFFAAAPPGSIPSGVGPAAATAGANLAAGAGACAASATGAVLPAIGGVVLPAVGAVALGVAGGFLINHIRERVAKNIYNGASILANTQAFLDGYRSVCGFIGNTMYIARTDDPNIVLGYCTRPNGFRYVGYRKGYSSSGTSIREYRLDGSYSGSFYIPAGTDVIAYGASDFNKCEGLYIGVYNSITPQDIKGYFSPDVIGENGNQVADYTNGNYILPNVYPVYNYGNTIINYINPTDYNTFVQNANQNTADGLTGEDTQGNYFDNFITPYIQTIEDVPENPDQPENPENPEQKPSVPYPDPTIPDAQPEIIEPLPDSDIQPTTIPYPTPIEPMPDDISETNDKITPFDLTRKFPFSIPFDLLAAFSLFSGPREAPYFVFEIPFGIVGTQTITIDMSAWDGVAAIGRVLQLILFVILLIIGTPNLIGK